MVGVVVVLNIRELVLVEFFSGWCWVMEADG